MQNPLRKQLHQEDIEELMTTLEERLKPYRRKISVETTRNNGVITDIEINIKIMK